MMNWLCRIGLHNWREETVVRAEDMIALNYDCGVCARCGKVEAPELAREAYFLMRANFRAPNVKMTAHPALGLNVPPLGN